MSLPFSFLLQAGAPGSTGFLAPLLMYGAIFAIFYFLLIRPQQKQRKAHEQLMLQVKKGDRIVTAGGLVGEVVAVKMGASATPDDEITVRSGESRVVVERGRIAKIATVTGTASSADKVA
jgi:preprotein translocase subunit YajC